MPRVPPRIEPLTALRPGAVNRRLRPRCKLENPAEKAGGQEAPMTADERCQLTLAFARVLYVNGQATEQTVSAAERLARALGLRATILPQWGVLDLLIDDKQGNLTAQVAADPAGVEMDRVASAMRAIDAIEQGVAVANCRRYVRPCLAMGVYYPIWFRHCGRRLGRLHGGRAHPHSDFAAIAHAVCRHWLRCRGVDDARRIPVQDGQRSPADCERLAHDIGYAQRDHCRRPDRCHDHPGHELWSHRSEVGCRLPGRSFAAGQTIGSERPDRRAHV